MAMQAGGRTPTFGSHAGGGAGVRTMGIGDDKAAFGPAGKTTAQTPFDAAAVNVPPREARVPVIGW